MIGWKNPADQSQTCHTADPQKHPAAPLILMSQALFSSIKPRSVETGQNIDCL
jgi:hypothetical protein